MNEIEVLNKVRIEDYIYEIRGKHVMLDFDLARLYHCTNGTKDINKAVKRNIERFPDNFYFQLTEKEYNNLRFQIGTANRNMSRTLPYAFTEQGIAMLASVLHTETAVKTSITIMNAFVSMRKFINTDLLEQRYVNNLVMEHDYDIKLLKESFSKLEEKKKNNEIYFNGQIYDAYSKIHEIFKKAKNKLVIIDAYADISILDIIKRLKVNIILITKPNNLLTNQDITRYNKQYNNLKVIYDNTFHDRYFIIDDKIVYHCGNSINRIGYKTFSINLVGDSDICNLLIKKVNKLK